MHHDDDRDPEASVLLHICEVCDATAVLTPQQTFADGWDYPPRMGAFAVVSPRTCPACPITETLWWEVVVERKTADELSAHHRQVLARILGEPGTITVTDE